MPNRINQLLMKEYTSRFANGHDVIAVGYEGMTVERTNQFRTALEEKEIGILFVKNRIAKLAFKELGRADIGSILSGQTALTSAEDPVALARFLVDFQKENKEVFKIHGALVEDTVIDGSGVVDLSKSPTKEELKGKILGQALGPGAKLSAQAIGPAGMLAGQVKALIEKKEEAGEAA